MANRRQIDEELELARSAQRSMGQKARDYSNGPNLSKSGSPKGSGPTAGSGKEQPLVRREKGGGGKDRDEGAAARRSMNGVNISQTPSTSAPSSSHVDGKATKYKKVSAQDWGANDDLGGGQQKGVAITKITRLAVPIVRPIRAATPDGVTSFHFSHEAITKTAVERVSDSGSKTRPGSARDHSRYLERETALARDEEGVIEKLEKDGETAQKTEAEIEADEIKKAFGQAEAGSIYIERQEALAVNTNGVAVLYSNIAESAAERRAFWNLVEEHEKRPGEDSMRVRMSANFDMWARVLNDPSCPEKVKETLTKADPDLEVRIQTENNEIMRRLMMKHGWTPPKRDKRQETAEEREIREKQEDKQAGVIFEDARGGRIQYRIIGELPHETDHEGRVKILRGMAQEFEKRNLPYMAVMHAPDHTNNDKNWHFHLIYHDQPAKRFTGKAEDHLPPLDPNATDYKKRQWQIAADALETPEVQSQIGKWDFDVVINYKQKCRHVKTSRPYAQEKDREPTRRPFLPMLRKRLADLTNEELERVGSRRRLDPRRYSEIGIDRTPDMHLGTKLSQHEQLGIPTGIGVVNERNQWNFIMGGIQKEQEQRERDLKGEVSQMRSSLSASAPDKPDADRITSAIIAYEQNMRAANEHAAIARHIEEHYWRAQSRAKKLEETCEKHLKAIAGDKASKRVKKHAGDYQAKLDEAREHLAGIDALMAAEIKQIAVSREIELRLKTEAQQQRFVFDELIKEVRAKKGMPELSAENDNQRRPAAANDDEKARKVVGQANERLGTGDEGKGALSKKEMDAYIATIMKENLRLVVRNRLVVPKHEDPRFANIVTAPNYRTLMPRLTGIHNKQNETLNKLLEAIDADPKIIQIGQNEKGQSIPVVKTADKTLQAAFLHFGDEKRVIMAVEAAMASTGLKIAPVPVTSQTAEDTQVPVVKPADKKPAPVAPSVAANDVGDLLIKEIAARRFSAVETIDVSGGKAVVGINTKAALRIGIGNQVEITPQQARKMQAALRYSEREKTRLAAYISKAPQSVTIDNDGIRLATTAPKEIREIAAAHSADPERLQQYRNLHQDAIEKKANSVAPVAPIKDAAREVAQAPKQVVSGEKKNVDQAPVQQPVANTNKTDKPKVAEAKPANEMDQVAAGKSTPAKSGEDRSVPIAPEGFDLSRPSAPAPRDTEQAGRRFGRPDTPSVPPARVDNDIEDNKPRIRTLGTKSALANDPSTNPELQRPEPAKKPKAAPQNDLFDIDAERERIRAGRIGTPQQAKELQKGLHPLIDRWIEAVEQKDQKLRQLAAEEIQNNQRAKRIAKQLKEEEQGRIREDARLARETAERRAENERSQSKDNQKDLYRDLYRKGDDS